MNKCVIPKCGRKSSRMLQWDTNSVALCPIHYREILTIHGTTLAPYNIILDHMGVDEPESNGHTGPTGASGAHV